MVSVAASNAQAPIWKTYQSKKLGFAIEFPSEATVSERTERTFSYVRIQSSDHEGQLRPGEVLIDIFVVPKKFWGATNG
jgi:hypothetical protein